MPKSYGSFEEKTPDKSRYITHFGTSMLISILSLLSTHCL